MGQYLIPAGGDRHLTAQRDIPMEKGCMKNYSAKKMVEVRTLGGRQAYSSKELR